jgi:hypothetical protein
MCIWLKNSCHSGQHTPYDISVRSVGSPLGLKDIFSKPKLFFVRLDSIEGGKIQA